jgi:hypothetical protein
MLFRVGGLKGISLFVLKKILFALFAMGKDDTSGNNACFAGLLHALTAMKKYNSHSKPSSSTGKCIQELSVQTDS